MDFANLLTSYLRTIGLSARPVTTTDLNNYNYHEWTECWLPEVSTQPNDHWAVLDATNSPGYPTDAVLPNIFWTNKKIDYDSTETWWPWWHSRVYTSDATGNRIDARDAHYEGPSAAEIREISDNCSIMIYPTTDKSLYTFGENVSLEIEFRNIDNTIYTNTYDVIVAQYRKGMKV